MRGLKSSLTVSKRPKLQCEVCGEANKHVLHRHHIVERTEQNTSNDDFNIAIVCANCHAKVHTGQLEIIGVFPGTKPPTGRILVYKLDGVCNYPDLANEQPYYKPQTNSIKYFGPHEK